MIFLRYKVCVLVIFIYLEKEVVHMPNDSSLEQPNQETIEAMLEGEQIAKDSSVKGYRDLETFFSDLKS